MGLFNRGRPTLPGVQGTVRVDTRTTGLVSRLRPGDVAVVDHLDLDQASAEALLARRPAAVLNAARSTSGRYPNLGPSLLVGAGVPLVDDLGPDVLTLREGRTVRVDEGRVYDGERLVAEGTVQDAASVAAATEEARAGLAVHLEAFAAGTVDHLRRERELLLDGVGIPAITTDLTDKHVVVAVRGHHHAEDLAALRRYLREYRPVLVGVDGGAEVLLEAGLRPHLVITDLDAATDRVLTCGAEIVVRTDPDTTPALDRLTALGVTHVPFPATGTAEDAALLLADHHGAALIVAVGSHTSLVEFLDRGRTGMASSFLTRLRVGTRLVDAAAVARLYRRRVSVWQLLLLVAAGLGALVVALAVTPAGRSLLAWGWAGAQSLWQSVTALFGG